MADLATDPFTQVYTAIWALLEAAPTFTTIVKEGNRRLLDQAFSPGLKRSRSIADWPQVELVPIGGVANMTPTNKVSPITATYGLTISSGSDQLSALHFPAQWQTIRALARASTTLGLSFVEDFRFASFDTVTDVDEALFQGHGFVTRMEIIVRMQFTQATFVD